MGTDIDCIIAGGESTRHRLYRFGRPDALPHAVGGSVPDSADRLSIVVAAVERHQGRMVGAVRTNLLREGLVPPRASRYILDDLPSDERAHTAVTRWTLAPGADIQGRPDVALRLAWTLYDFQLRERIRYDYLDCLDIEVTFFAGLGYRRLRAIDSPEHGPRNLMRLDIYDWTHLAQVSSPFLALAREAVS